VHGLPILNACRKYANDSRDEHTFLAGSTPAERFSRRTKKTEITKRRRQVQGLHRLGASTSVIAELVERDPGGPSEGTCAPSSSSSGPLCSTPRPDPPTWSGFRLPRRPYGYRETSADFHSANRPPV